MRIKASVLTPILAMLTVVALVGTGIVLGQVHRGDASVTLLDSTLNSVVAAATDPATVVETETTEAETTETETTVTSEGLLQPLIDQSAALGQAAPAGPVLVTGSQRPAASPATIQPTRPVTTRPVSPPTTQPASPPTTVQEPSDLPAIEHDEDAPSLDEVDEVDEPSDHLPASHTDDEHPDEDD